MGNLFPKSFYLLTIINKMYRIIVIDCFVHSHTQGRAIVMFFPHFHSEGPVWTMAHQGQPRQMLIKLQKQYNRSNIFVHNI